MQTQTEQKTEYSTWIELDKSRLLGNLHKIEERYGFDAKILAVIKANAYGHGLIPIAEALGDHVHYLGVSSVHEALELREHNENARVFVFGQLLSSELKTLIGENITLSVSSFEQAAEIDKISEEKKCKTAIHIKVDTGMGRLGIPFRKAVLEVEKIAELKNIELEGIYSHFPAAEKEDGKTEKQARDFELLIKALAAKEIRFIFKHIANSTGLLKHPDAEMNLLRPGLSLYGVYPDKSLTSLINLEPVLSLKSRVVMVKRLMPGESAGYGRDFIADKPTTIAIVPIGYSHGYPFKISRESSVLIHGKHYPLAGRISMDYICINLGDDFAEAGEVVTLIGEDGDESIRISEIANLAGTIPYEILTGLNARIPRVCI